MAMNRLYENLANRTQVLLDAKQSLDLEVEIRKQTETELRKLTRAVEHSPVSIIIVNAKGEFEYVNPQFTQLTGYSIAELIGKTPRILKSGEMPSSVFENLWATIIVGEAWRGELLNRKKNGELYWDYASISPSFDVEGKITHYVSAQENITERKLAEKTLQLQQQFSEDIIDSLPGIFYMLNQQGQFVRVNHQFSNISGYTKDELDGITALDLFGGNDKQLIAQKIQEVFKTGDSCAEANFITKYGLKIPYYFTGHRTNIDNQNYLVGLGTDISERKKAEDALRIAAATFESHEAILITDVQGNIMRTNHAFTDITGYSQEEVLGKNPRIMSSGRQDRAFYIEMWQQLLYAGSWSGEIWDRRKNGEVYPKWMTITAVKSERQETTHYVAIFSDITARKHAEEEIRDLAFYDTLTGLPNRRLLNDRLSQAFSTSKRSTRYGALMFLDLDNFKPLNDTHGHAVGDLLLIDAADRLKNCVRKMDTVARFGGDEFVVILCELDTGKVESTKQAEIVAEKIRTVLSEPYLLTPKQEGQPETTIEHHCTASIGVALFINHEDSQEDISKQADAAMYQAKKAGRNQIRFYDAKD